jgi:hypothetical protein
VPIFGKEGMGDFIKFNIYLLLKEYVEEKRVNQKKGGSFATRLL